jgi:hypothetical protein
VVVVQGFAVIGDLRIHSIKGYARPRQASASTTAPQPERGWLMEAGDSASPSVIPTPRRRIQV